MDSVTYVEPSDETTTDHKKALAEEQARWEAQWESPPFRFDPSDQLQVIVMLTNINLTPERPDFRGGSWHVEGLFGRISVLMA